MGIDVQRLLESVRKQQDKVERMTTMGGALDMVIAFSKLQTPDHFAALSGGRGAFPVAPITGIYVSGGWGIVGADCPGSMFRTSLIFSSMAFRLAKCSCISPSPNSLALN